MKQVRVAMAQLHPTPGDVRGNTAQIVATAAPARDECRADVVLFPELALLGYPPHDLLRRKHLPVAVDDALATICSHIRGIVAVFGYPEFSDGSVHNAIAVVRDGRIIAGCRRQYLTRADCCGERHFSAGAGHCVLELAGVRMGIVVGADAICSGPLRQARADGAEVL